MDVSIFAIDRPTNAPLRKEFKGVNLPSNHDLMIAVTDWSKLDADVQAVNFP